jgi:hypothetical protein
MIRYTHVLLVGALTFWCSSSWAGEQYQFRGKLGNIRGHVTISDNSIDVEKRCLWTRDYLAYDFKDIKSVRVKRGLFRTRVVLRETSQDRFIQVTTWAWHYEAIRELLKDKL